MPYPLFCLGQLLVNGLVAWAAFAFLCPSARFFRANRLALLLWLALHSLLAALNWNSCLPGAFLLQGAVSLAFGRLILKIPLPRLAPPWALLLVCLALFQGFSALLISMASRQLRLPGNGLFFQLLFSAFLAVLFCLLLNSIRSHFLYLPENRARPFPLPSPRACLWAIGAIRLPLRLDAGFEAYLATFPFQSWAASLLALTSGVFLLRHALVGARQMNRLAAQAENRQAAFQQAMTQNRRNAAFRHDIDNHLLALSGLIRQQRFQQAAQYAATLRTAGKPELDTGCAALDGLLTEKLRLARSLGIRTCWQVQIPAGFPADSVDLCSIFANLCDNSLSACAALPPDRRDFTLSAKSRGSLLLIEASNPCQSQRFREGTGLANLRRISRAYQGTVDIRLADGRFQVNLLLAPETTV